MTPELIASLEKLIEYVWRDEELNWEEAGRPPEHIFIEIKKINDYLAEQKKV